MESVSCSVRLLHRHIYISVLILKCVADLCVAGCGCPSDGEAAGDREHNVEASCGRVHSPILYSTLHCGEKETGELWRIYRECAVAACVFHIASVVTIRCKHNITVWQH